MKINFKQIICLIALCVSIYLIVTSKCDEIVVYEAECGEKQCPVFAMYAACAEDMFSTPYKVKRMVWEDNKIKITWSVINKNSKWKIMDNMKLKQFNKDVYDEAKFQLRERFNWFRKAIKNQQWLDQRGYDHFEDARDEMGKPFWLRKVPKK